MAALGLLTANCASQAQKQANVQAVDRYNKKYGVKSSPRVYKMGEAIPKGGGRSMVGKTYTVAGKSYTPRVNRNYTATGTASWYGEAFHGRYTANGEVFDKDSVAAAHPTLPLPSYVRVTNLDNDRSMIVRVNDRGPYHGKRLIDVSQKVAEALDFERMGTGKVKVEYVGDASVDGSDDNKLMATLRDDGRPAMLRGSTAPIMMAGLTAAPRPAPVALAAAEPPQASEHLRDEERRATSLVKLASTAPRNAQVVDEGEEEAASPSAPAKARVAAADHGEATHAAAGKPASKAAHPAKLAANDASEDDNAPVAAKGSAKLAAKATPGKDKAGQEKMAHAKAAHDKPASAKITTAKLADAKGAHAKGGHAKEATGKETTSKAGHEKVASLKTAPGKHAATQAKETGHAKGLPMPPQRPGKVEVAHAAKGKAGKHDSAKDKAAHARHAETGSSKGDKGERIRVAANRR